MQQDAFATGGLIGILLTLAVGIFLVMSALGLNTIIYVDVSGSTSTGVIRTNMIAKLKSIRKPFARVKTASHDVKDTGVRLWNCDMTRVFNGAGGPSLLSVIVKDFRASGAREAIIVTDGEFFDSRDFAAEPNLNFVLVPFR